MAKIPFQISAAPSITNNLVAILHQTAPGGGVGPEVDRILDTTDHSSPKNFLFDNLDPGTYLIRIYETPDDGTTLSTLRHDWWQDAVTDETIIEFLFYVVNGPGDHDPVTGVEKIIDPYFVGKNVAGLFQSGNRQLKKGVEWQVNSSNEIELLNDMVTATPIQNYDQAVWVVTIIYTQVATAVSNQNYGDPVIITGDTNFGTTYYNKKIYARATGNKLTLTIQALASIPENRGFELIHDGGNAINVVLQLQPGEIVRFRGADRNDVKLGIGEKISCVKKTISGTSYLFADPIFGQWDRIGMIEPVRQLGVNQLLADGITEYDLSVYLRLDEYMDGLPAEQVVDYATQATKTGLYGKDVINNRARLPNLLNSSIRFLKNIGGSDTDRPDNIPGGYQGDGVGAYTASVQGRQAAVAGGNGGVANIVPLKSTMVPPFTGSVEHVTGLEINGGSSDTRGKNHGFIPAILI